MSENSRRLLAVLGISLGCLIAFMDFSIINTALPVIQSELNASTLQLQWSMNIFVLLLCPCMILAGRLSDTFGHRRIFYLGIILFTIASVGAGFSMTPAMFIFFRGLQGISVTLVVPSSAALVTEAFPPEKQASALGIWTAITGVGIALGPVLGGLIVTYINWRWIFFVNLPIAIIAMAMCLPTVKESSVPDSKHIDYVGFAIMSLGIILLITGLIQAPDWGWTSMLTWGSIIAGIIVIIIFLKFEAKVNNPILPLSVFKIRNFVTAEIGRASCRERV